MGSIHYMAIELEIVKTMVHIMAIHHLIQLLQDITIGVIYIRLVQAVGIIMISLGLEVQLAQKLTGPIGDQWDIEVVLL